MRNIQVRELSEFVFMYPLIRTEEELFSTTVTNFYRSLIKKHTDPKTKTMNRKMDVYVINASWYDVSYSGYIDAMNGNDPVSANETTNLGLIYGNGKILSGKSAKNGYYLSYTYDNLLRQKDISSAVKMGIGDPIVSSSTSAAFGDIGPLIINNFPYGSKKLYKKEAPKNAPLFGEPPTEFRNYLIQRSSAKFAQFSQKDKEESYVKGKTCIGFSSSKLIIAVQQDGVAGSSLEDIRDYFLQQNCKYAAFFDGSDSSMLFENGQFIISMGQNKNELCTAGIAIVKFY